MNSAPTIDDLVAAVLEHRALDVRVVANDLRLAFPDWRHLPKPASLDETTQIVASGLAELLAEYCGCEPPEWAANCRSLDRPVYLIKSAASMRNLRKLCDEQSPEPLRRRNLFAPPGFLDLR